MRSWHNPESRASDVGETSYQKGIRLYRESEKDLGALYRGLLRAAVEGEDEASRFERHDSPRGRTHSTYAEEV